MIAASHRVPHLDGANSRPNPHHGTKAGLMMARESDDPGQPPPTWPWRVGYASLAAILAAAWALIDPSAVRVARWVGLPTTAGPDGAAVCAVILAVAVTGVGILVFGFAGSWAAANVSQIVRDEPSDPKAEWMGLIEGLAFTTVAIFHPVAAMAGVFPWMALKIAANWEPRTSDKPRLQAKLATDRTASILGGLTSLGFAVAGGAIIHAALGL